MSQGMMLTNWSNVEINGNDLKELRWGKWTDMPYTQTNNNLFVLYTWWGRM